MSLSYLGKVFNSIFQNVYASGEDKKILAGNYKLFYLAFKLYFVDYERVM